MFKLEVWLTITGVAATAFPTEKASVAKARQEESRNRFASEELIFMEWMRVEGWCAGLQKSLKAPIC